MGQKLLRFDRFGQSLSILIDEGKSSLPSKLGSFCSFLLLICLIAYAGYKASVLERKQSVDILTAVIEDHYDSSYVFEAAQGLNIALFVFNPFDPATFQALDPTYGRIRF